VNKHDFDAVSIRRTRERVTTVGGRNQRSQRAPRSSKLATAFRWMTAVKWRQASPREATNHVQRSKYYQHSQRRVSFLRYQVLCVTPSASNSPMGSVVNVIPCLLREVQLVRLRRQSRCRGPTCLPSALGPRRNGSV
jgi:hypothetical protein